MKSVITKRHALELKKTIKETTGKKLELSQVYILWSYICKLLMFIWKVNNKNIKNKKQKSLFSSE